MSPLERLVHDLGHPGMPAELAALLGCLANAKRRHAGNERNNVHLGSLR